MINKNAEISDVINSIVENRNFHDFLLVIKFTGVKNNQRHILICLSMHLFKKIGIKLHIHL